MSLVFRDEDHAYELDGVRLPSVTEILGMLNDFSSVSPPVLQQAARRGSLVHEYTQLIDYGADAESLEIEPELVGYVQAWLAFEHDWQPTWELIEHPVHRGTEYAGTLDRFGQIDGHFSLVDIKTASSASPRQKIIWAAQLYGYAQAIVSKYEDWYDGFLALNGIRLRWDVLLKKDGSYTIIDYVETAEKYGFHPSEVFESCLYLYNVLNRRNK